MNKLTLIETKEMTFDDLIKGSGYNYHGFKQFRRITEYYCPEYDHFYNLQSLQNLVSTGLVFKVIPIEKYRLLLLTGGICALNPST